MARGPQSKVHADALALRKRDEQILNMRAELRMSERQIAEKVGLSQAQVSRILHRLLKERVAAMAPRQEELIQEVILRHERRYQILLGISRSESSTDSAKMIAVSGMRAEDEFFCKRLGLDAPVKVEHSFRQEPMTSEEIERMRAVASPEEWVAIAASSTSTLIAVATRAGIPLLQ